MSSEKLKDSAVTDPDESAAGARRRSSKDHKRRKNKTGQSYSDLPADAGGQSGIDSENQPPGRQGEEGDDHSENFNLENRKNKRDSEFMSHDTGAVSRCASDIRRKVSDSLILDKPHTNNSELCRRISDIQKASYDSVLSTPTASAISTSAVSTSADSRVVSSPSTSGCSKSSSSPKRSTSPKLSRALGLKHERAQRERDLNETRSRLRKHQLGMKGKMDSKSTQDQDGEKNVKSHKPSLVRTKSEDMAKRRHVERLLSGKGSSYSLGTIKDMEERYGRIRHRSKSEKYKVKVAYEHKATSPGISPDRENPAASKQCEKCATDAFKSGSERTRKKSKSRKDEETTKDSVRRKVSREYSERPESSVGASAVMLSVSESQQDSDSSTVLRTKAVPRNGHSRLKNEAAEGDSSSEIPPSQYAQAGASMSQGADDFDMLPSHSTYTVRVISKNSESTGDCQKVLSLDDLSQSTNTKELLATSEEVERRTNKAIDAILRDGLPDIPTLENTSESVLLDWRAVFRVEMMRLRKEVNDFRQFCQSQIELHALAVAKGWSDKSGTDTGQPKNGLRTHEAPRIAEQLKDLEVNMQLFQRKQEILDLETELLEKEENLAEKQKNLEEYEKEILEVESMLNHRQAICDRRQRALVTLDEELQSLRQELEETRDQIHSDGSIPESNSERARKNWDMVRRNLMDKQHLLETTVQKYRSELAAATSTIAGKDILISRLQGAAIEHEEELANKDRRIKQLESKLTLALSETKTLSDQLANNAYRDILGHSNGSDHSSNHASRRPSQELTPDYSRVSLRNLHYRRPSTNAGSDQGDDYKPGFNPITSDHGTTELRNGTRIVRKRNNSITDNAISRLTLSTPRTDDKFGRGSSACAIQ